MQLLKFESFGKAHGKEDSSIGRETSEYITVLLLLQMNDKKRALLLVLVRQMKEAVSDEANKRDLDNISQTIAHTAPEILDSRWNRIFNYCRANLSQEGNKEHEECFKLYNNYFSQYKALHNSIQA